MNEAEDWACAAWSVYRILMTGVRVRGCEWQRRLRLL